MEHRLDVWLETNEPGRGVMLVHCDGETDDEIGRVEVEVLEGNVVVTVRRVDEAKFGPVSLVVV